MPRRTCKRIILNIGWGGGLSQVQKLGWGYLDVHIQHHVHSQVCGTDGVTYENVCVLRAQSANARVDFLGACEEGTGRTPEEYCTMVSRARRCIFDTSNCRHLVRPEEGCCALCGKLTKL